MDEFFFCIFEKESDIETTPVHHKYKDICHFKISQCFNDYTGKGGGASGAGGAGGRGGDGLTSGKLPGKGGDGGNGGPVCGIGGAGTGGAGGTGGDQSSSNVFRTAENSRNCSY